jgi:2-hydroxychromene-2-carboxylate isomerase
MESSPTEPQAPGQGAALHFYFDLSSPYSFLAAQWVEPLAWRHGREVHWHAILLGVTFAAAELKSPVSHPLKREYSLRDFERSARFEGVRLKMPAVFPIATQQAARVFHALNQASRAQAAEWAKACFAAYFQFGVNLSDPAGLEQVARDFGLPEGRALELASDPRWKDSLRQANQQAIEAGVFGAPFFLVDGEPFWGNDRKPQLEAWLRQPF